jgi:phosphoribosylpyrophosphate synthetase
VGEIEQFLNQQGINMKVVPGYLNKTRISPHKVVMENGILGEDGRELSLPQDTFFIILDDETSTGMTVKVATYHLVNNLGFNWWHIYAGIVHGKFVEGPRNFYTEGEDNIPPRFIASLDTLNVPEGIKTIFIFPLLVESLQKFLLSNNFNLLPL